MLEFHFKNTPPAQNLSQETSLAQEDWTNPDLPWGLIVYWSAPQNPEALPEISWTSLVNKKYRQGTQ